MKFSEIKERSRQQLSGNWIKSAAVILVMSVIMFLLYFYINSLLAHILSIPIWCTVMGIFFRVANNEGLDLNKIVLTRGEYIKYFIYSILIGIIQFAIIMLGMMVAGLAMFTSFVNADELDSIKTAIITASSVGTTALLIALVIYILFVILVTYIEIMYSMTPYIIFGKNEDIDAISAMKYSRQIMKGYKWKLFLFELSFIGWGILSVATLGIGLLFLVPYYTTSMTNFYFELIKEKSEFAAEKGLIV